MQKRTTNYVDHAVQGAILWRLLLHCALFLITAALFTFFVEMLAGQPREVLQSFWKRQGPNILAVLVLTPMFLLDLSRLTNRFAGPMVRLRRGMHELAQGRDVAPLQFRRDDFWQDLAGDFNRVAQRVRSSNTRLSTGDTPVAVSAGVDENDC